MFPKTCGRWFFAIGVGALSFAANPAGAQTMGPDFAGSYSIFNLGSAPSVPFDFGGLALRQEEPNQLYLGGGANGSTGAIYRVGLERDGSGSIVSWGCTATEIATTAPNVDGGVCFGPEGVLAFATYPNNLIGQTLPGQSSPAKFIALSPLGVTGSTGSITFVPPGFAGAGVLKIVSYNTGDWYSAVTQAAGDGTFDVLSVAHEVTIIGKPEGMVYVRAGNPGFTSDSVLVTEYGSGAVSAYEIDANGDPLAATRRIFVQGLSSAEGAAIDPLTGDFMFSTFGSSNKVIRVTGFTQSASCIGDIDGSRSIDGADLGMLLGAWGDCPYCPEDLNGDCAVDGLDLGVLLGGWGSCR